ncbi:hypothetical protein PSACC_00493 [Paramicrosporidium saccamoebae]|uniref:Uncharacterized protein n=1 Tax=Paramicrosporidium saccamoebae TaxID=1246581 RepID=A0A2H9TPN3_9FUNG|nr:hypothetical protein PSACC_00493 [Paramicrosporidium saccamoebae]
MPRVDVGVLSIRLLKTVCTQNLLLLICTIVADLYFVGALETKFRRLLLFLAVTSIIGVAKILGIMPRLHVMWVWLVIAVGAYEFEGEGRPMAALFMLCLGWAIGLILNATGIVADSDLDEWSPIFVIVIIILGLAAAARCSGHWRFKFVLVAGWTALAPLCCPFETYLGYEDSEILLLATGAAFSHFLTACNIEIKINLKL